jgi:hypothetical protein
VTTAQRSDGRLDTLLLAGDITRDEYERQRASIIASV